MDETVPDEIQPSSFEHEEEFMQVLQSFLNDDAWDTPVTAVGNASSPQMSRLSAIVEFCITPIGWAVIDVVGIFVKLDAYQEQPFLLDQYLSNMVEPVVEALKKEIRNIVKQDDIASDRVIRLHQLCTLMYWYSKTRGTKSIGR
jgi:hypothetical protein